MTGKKASSLTELLTRPEAHLAGLAAEAARLEALRRRLLPLLPADAAPHCLGADLEQGVLTLFLDSGAWTTALRYRHQALTAAVQDTFKLPCYTLKLKVLPDPKPGVPPRPAPRELSSDTRRLLDSTAAGIDDADLAEALRRLARGPGSRP